MITVMSAAETGIEFLATNEIVLFNELVDKFVYDITAVLQKLAVDKVFSAEYQLCEFSTVRNLPKRGQLQRAANNNNKNDCIKLKYQRCMHTIRDDFVMQRSN